MNKPLGKHFHPPKKNFDLVTLFQTLLFSSIWSINQVGSFLAGFLAPLRIEESKTGPSKLLICPTNLGSFNQNAFKVIRSINFEAANFNQIFAYFFASVKGSKRFKTASSSSSRLVEFLWDQGGTISWLRSAGARCQSFVTKSI